MFGKILIANRGEIACRVIQTCQRLAVRTVAVHSEIDAQSRHVEMADQAVALGGRTPSESYLRGDAMIEAALSTGAEAIHPGYGFLSENPDFVEEVEKAGLIFIGPSAEAIRAMGLKDAAKALMEKASVPVVPGYHGSSQGGLAERAAEIGYPVLIKAVAGGGGKGMRLVERANDFDAALKDAKSEAKAAFGNDAVLIEKFVEKPRHIEVQVFGDGTDAVYLFERDCSLQRRHQKVIEEAPAPGMTDEMRHAMGAAAVNAAKAVGYSGAGTVEFIVDGSDGLRPDRFYFMEMNTRLQVEHPVTEEITGVDLVEWQLEVAAGGAIPLRQDELAITGHSFEARLYAEDVPAGFLPAIGRLDHLKFPASARIDTGVRQGDEISPFYDPMIAKITVHGADRSSALAKLEGAISETELVGTTTNLGFLRALTRHEGFAAGDVDTGLIARDLDTLTEVASPCSRTKALAAVVALDLQQDTQLQGFSLWSPLAWIARLSDEGTEFSAQVQKAENGSFDVTIGDTNHNIDLSDGIRVDDEKIAATYWSDDERVAVFWGNTYHFDRIDPLQQTKGAEVSDATIAPMPGLVKDVFVSVGDMVEEGDALLILEAMKMEHRMTASRTGRVAEVTVAQGAQVASGDLLVQLEDPS